MEQTNNMVEQIGKLVANELIRGRGVYLPTFGTLVVETLPSQLSSDGKMIYPPRNIIKFIGGETQVGGATSLVETLSREGGCDSSTAEDIYTRWMERVKGDGGVQIVGVGAVVGERFDIDSQLDMTLNPEEYKRLQLRKRGGGWIWIAASILICAVVGLAANYMTTNYLSDKKTTKTVIEATKLQPATPIEREVVEEVDTTERPTYTAPPQEEQLQATQLKYRVVYGVFSTMENARKGAELAREASSSASVKISPLGQMFMVIIFESNDIEEAREFLRNNRSVFHDEIWVSEKRGA